MVWKPSSLGFVAKKVKEELRCRSISLVSEEDLHQGLFERKIWIKYPKIDFYPEPVSLWYED